jgi:hypothetical protein
MAADGWGGGTLRRWRSRGRRGNLCVNTGKTGYFATIGAAVAKAEAG